MILGFCQEAGKRVHNIKEIREKEFMKGMDWEHIRERPAAISVDVKSIDDTSNFEDFPDVDIKIPAPPRDSSGGVQPFKDWVFINYTFKRFEGLNQHNPVPDFGSE